MAPPPSKCQFRSGQGWNPVAGIYTRPAGKHTPPKNSLLSRVPAFEAFQDPPTAAYAGILHESHRHHDTFSHTEDVSQPTAFAYQQSSKTYMPTMPASSQQLNPDYGAQLDGSAIPVENPIHSRADVREVVPGINLDDDNSSDSPLDQDIFTEFINFDGVLAPQPSPSDPAPIRIPQGSAHGLHSNLITPQQQDRYADSSNSTTPGMTVSRPGHATSFNYENDLVFYQTLEGFLQNDIGFMLPNTS